MAEKENINLWKTGIRIDKQENRKIKIYPKCLSRSFGIIIVPEIRLCGKWLQKHGFNNGDQIIVSCKVNEIHIKLAPKIDEQSNQ